MSVELTTIEGLRRVLAHPGPFLSVYVDVDRSPAEAAATALELRRESLLAVGATEVMIDTALRRLSAPLDVAEHGGRGLIVAADGAALDDVGDEPPSRSLADLSPIPRCGPMLEWEQRRVAHVVITTHENGADLAVVEPRLEPRVHQLTGSSGQIARAAADAVEQVDATLVVVVDPTGERHELVPRLHGVLPATARVATPNVRVDSIEKAAEAIVREVSDEIARATVGALRDYRFRRTHDAAASGLEETVDALRAGVCDLLLVNDDFEDHRTLFVGRNATDLATTQTPWAMVEVRAADALLRTALLSHVDVRLVPRAASGPDEAVAALTDVG